MRTYTLFKSSLYLLLSMLLLTSCGISKIRVSMAEAREKEKKAFVELKTGEIIEASEARLKVPFFGQQTIQLDNDLKVPVKDIVAYQNHQAYYKRIQIQFMPRVKKGLINVYRGVETRTEFYRETTYNGPTYSGTRTRSTPVYYLQKGDTGVVRKFSVNVVKDLVQDYKPAMEFMHLYDENRKTIRRWSIINITAMLGGAILAGTSANNDQKIRLGQGYAGLGLLAGGMISGFINNGRAARNASNLELAIDTYNYQTVKKRR